MQRALRRPQALGALAVLLIAGVLALWTGPRSASADPTSCDTCVRTYPCDLGIGRCLTDCQERYRDAQVSLENCITACNRSLEICRDQAQVECVLSRACP